MAGIVERYLDAIVSHDWDVVSECVADDIVRVGPYGDRYEGRDEYLAFIADTMPKLKGYVMELHRVTYANDGLAFAELSETVELDGKPMLTPEVLVFELDADRRIVRVDIFIQHRGRHSRNSSNPQKFRLGEESCGGTGVDAGRRPLVGRLMGCSASCPVFPISTTCGHWPAR